MKTNWWNTFWSQRLFCINRIHCTDHDEMECYLTNNRNIFLTNDMKDSQMEMWQY